MADESLADGGNRRRVQRRRIRKDGWTKARRKIFIAALAETCNVRLSAARVGKAPSSPYDLRRRDAAFAQLWDDALAMGYDRLEALLLQRAIEGVNDLDLSALPEDGAVDEGTADAITDEPARGHRRPGSGIPPGIGRGDVQLALAMLNRRGAKDGLRSGPRKAMGSDEVDALLTKKLDALARRRART